MHKHRMALMRAIQIVGNQTKLAALIGVTPKRLNNWLNRDKKIPFDYALLIEKATGGQISRYELAPHVRIINPIQPLNSVLESPALSLLQDSLNNLIDAITSIFQTFEMQIKKDSKEQ